MHCSQGIIVKSPTNVNIYWDLDNVKPKRAAEFFQLKQLIESVVYDIAGLDSTINVFANPSTHDSLSDLDALAADADVTLVATSARKQSTDLAVRSMMLRFAEAYKGAAVIACVSDDTDFVPVLTYCTRTLGCTTIAIGTFRSSHRPRWAAPRRLSNLPLARAATHAVALRRPEEVSSCHLGSWTVAATYHPD